MSFLALHSFYLVKCFKVMNSPLIKPPPFSLPPRNCLASVVATTNGTTASFKRPFNYIYLKNKFICRKILGNGKPLREMFYDHCVRSSRHVTIHSGLGHPCFQVRYSVHCHKIIRHFTIIQEISILFLMFGLGQRDR